MTRSFSKRRLLARIEERCAPIVRSALSKAWHLTATIVVLFCSHAAVDAADELTITPVERWSAVFAGDQARWTFRITSDVPFRGRCAWSLLAKQRALARGEVEVRVDADKPLEIAFPLRWPDVKLGTVLDAELTVSISAAGQETVAGRHVKPIWIYSREPFAERQEWLKALKLSVFDPEGNTIEKFEAAAIPHARLRSREALDDVSEGIVLVGEGTSLKRNDDLMIDLQKLASRGVSVLCLASPEGVFPWPGDNRSLRSVDVQRADVIRKLDKRLDATAWAADLSSVGRGLKLTTSEDDVVAEISADASAWPWCEWQFTSSHDSSNDNETHRLIWCGFPIIEAWDKNPTPRFLLAKLLERLSKQPMP